MNSLSLSVVVPVYNEVDNIQPLISEIRQALEGKHEFEIIFVDDGSTDGSRERLKQLREQYAELNVVLHQGNYGQSAGLLSGVRAAKHEWIVTLDGDGQNDPQDILALVKAVTRSLEEKQVIMAAGQRAKRHDNFIRKVSSVIANKVRGFLLKDNCPDTGCGLKLFSKSVFLSLPHFDHIHRFLPALFNRQGIKVMHIPVNHRHRVHGQSKYGVWNRLWVGIVDLFGLVWLIRRPLAPRVEE